MSISILQESSLFLWSPTVCRGRQSAALLVGGAGSSLRETGEWAVSGTSRVETSRIQSETSPIRSKSRNVGLSTLPLASAAGSAMQRTVVAVEVIPLTPTQYLSLLVECPSLSV